MPSIYADENYPYPVVLRLRALGYDVLTIQEDGRAYIGFDDPDVLARATELDRVVLTENRKDFHRLHQQQSNHAGIITNTTDADYDALTARIDDALRSRTDFRGQLVRVVRPATPPKRSPSP